MAVGPVLRSLFAHETVVEEIGRIGGIVDLTVLLAGGVASGPMVRMVVVSCTDFGIRRTCVLM